jgi:uncharacterized protein YnzC (UPF0291/DUF896 family)
MKLDFLSYYDRQLTDSILSKEKHTKYLIFQSMFQGDSLIVGENEDQIASFLFWMRNDSVFMKLITKEIIYTTVSMTSTKFFNYKYIDRVGADVKEDKLKFKSPLLEPRNSEVIIYHDCKRRFFFELGQVSLYIENPAKYKYRKEFIDMIKKEIKLRINKLEPESNYLRSSLF